MVLLTGALVTVFNISVTNVAIPDIASALNANGLQIHFIADGGTLTLASFVLFFGAIGDRYGRKLLFVLGCFIMFITSILSAISQSADMLVLCRLGTGIATAMLYPTTLSMLSTIFENPKQRLLAIGIWSGISAGGAAIAPVVAGTLLEFFTWGSVYLVSVPFTISACILGLKFLPEFKNKIVEPVDYLGGVFSVTFVSFLLFAIIIFPVDGLSERVIVSLCISLLSLILFIIREKTTKYPLLDLAVFKNARFSVASFTITLVAFAQLGVMFLAQQFVQNVLGYNTFEAGLSAFPLAISVLLASPLSAKLDGKIGSKKTIALGLSLVALGFITALFWTTHSPYSQILVSYILIGIGLGFTVTPSTNAIMNSLPKEKAGIASAVNDVTRDFGSSLGIAVNGSIAAISYKTTLDNVYNNLPESERIPIAENITRTITSSLSGALEVAQRYPGIDSQKLASAAKQAFLHGQIEAMLLSVVLCTVAAIIVFIFMPKETQKQSE